MVIDNTFYYALDTDVNRRGDPKPFYPWIHCEGDTGELEIMLGILRKQGINSAFFHEYMFIGEKKFKLIGEHIRKQGCGGAKKANMEAKCE